MAEIVNLRLARKRAARARKEREAERNRALHGMSKREKADANAKREAAARHLDGHRIDREGESE